MLKPIAKPDAAHGGSLPPEITFPGRTTLHVHEVAKKLAITKQHFIDLIEQGKLGAVDVGGGSRRFWRIPLHEYEKFIRSRHSLNKP